ncbi:MAG: hypothetical protein ABI619_01585 [Betaproteobacteria bacterium]
MSAHGASLWHALCTRLRQAIRLAFSAVDGSIKQENIMGKYFLGWLLGVPFFVLVILYLFFH